MNYAQLLAELPAHDSSRVQSRLDTQTAQSKHRIIVLDDDPTGVQTVHDVAVLTSWEKEAIAAELKSPARLFYILTNSRGLTREDSIELHTEIALNIHHAADEAQVKVMVICRGDSTLRGHYPHETQAVRAVFEKLGNHSIDGELICPCFPEGGRLTADDTHYLLDGERLIPVAETEFARDRSFGYRHSNLRDWVAEKTEGAWHADQVHSMSLRLLRSQDDEAILAKVLGLSGFGKLVINAISYDDLRVTATALLQALAIGKNYLIQSAAGLVKVLDNKKDRPLLQAQELVGQQPGTGGLIIVGSHVRRTTAQLQALTTLEGLALIEVNQHLALNQHEFSAEIARATREANEHLRAGKSTIVFTKRERLDLPGNNPEEELRLSRSISQGLTKLVADLKVRPRYVIAKGGITSSDIGVHGLCVRRAMVMGQVLPGVPVWEIGPESKFPGMPYVVFPGNVGQVDDLKHLVHSLEAISNTK